MKKSFCCRQLLAPNLIQKDFLSDAEQMSKQVKHSQ